MCRGVRCSVRCRGVRMQAIRGVRLEDIRGVGLEDIRSVGMEAITPQARWDRGGRRGKASPSARVCVDRLGGGSSRPPAASLLPPVTLFHRVPVSAIGSKHVAACCNSLPASSRVFPRCWRVHKNKREQAQGSERGRRRDGAKSAVSRALFRERALSRALLARVSARRGGTPRARAYKSS